MWLWWISLVLLALRLLLAPPPQTAEPVEAFPQDPDFRRAEETLGIEWRRFVRPAAGGLYLWRVELDLSDDIRAMAVALTEAAGDPTEASLDDVALRGLALAALDRHEEAADVFGEVLSRRPNCIEARVLRGIMLAELGRWNASETEWRRAVRLAPACPEVRLLEGVAHYYQDRAGEAAVVFEQIVAARPDWAPAWMSLSTALTWRHLSRARAIGAAERAWRLAPGEPDAWTGLAWTLWKWKSFSASRKAAEEAIRRFPRKDRPWRELGCVFAETRRLDEAAAAFRKGLDIRPDSPELLLAQAWLLGTKQERWEESAAVCRELVRLWPHFGWAWRKLGFTCKKLGRPAEAEQAYRHATEVEWWNEEGWTELAETLMQTGRHAAAADACRRRIAVQPSNPRAWVALGRALEAAGDWAETERVTRRALALMPAPGKLQDPCANMRASAWNSLAFSLWHQERWNESEAAYAAALNACPDDPHHIRNMAWIHAERGRRAEAEDAYRKALAIDPAHAQSWDGLAGLLGESRRWAELEALCRERIRSHPAHYLAWCCLAQSLLRQDKPPAEAEAAARRAVELRPACGWAKSRLGEALWRQGRFAHAEPLLREAVELQPRCADAWDALGRFLETRGDGEDARAAQAHAEALERESRAMEARRAARPSGLDSAPPARSY